MKSVQDETWAGAFARRHARKVNAPGRAWTHSRRRCPPRQASAGLHWQYRVQDSGSVTSEARSDSEGAAYRLAIGEPLANTDRSAPHHAHDDATRWIAG